MTTPLMIRSSYSLLESTIKISSLCRKAKEYGYTALALTDHDCLFGMPLFLKTCKEYGLKGIAGMETSVSYHEMSLPFLVLAQDSIGYQNLLRLASIIGETHQPVSLTDFCTWTKQCFLIAYGEGGYFDAELVHADMNGVRQKLALMKQDFPAFDLALSYMDSALWRERSQSLKIIAHDLQIHTVAVNKIYYLNEDDGDAWRAVNAIRLQQPLSSIQLQKGRYFCTPAQMAALYEQDDLERTDYIARQCTGDYRLPKASLPVFPTKDGVGADVYLNALCFTGLKKRCNGQPSESYIQRLEYELKIIHQMKFDDYFLIVYDFIRYAKKKGILIGPGRGSAAGSLVAYCLGITEIDPIEYGLLFERFLNPERISMPDIDTDIPDDRRDEVVSYLIQKYGKECVGEIIIYGTFGARQVLHDLIRIMQINENKAALLLRNIPQSNISAQMSLTQIYQNNTRIREILNADDQLQSLWNLAVKLEDLPRHTSVHPAGVILSDRPLVNTVPVLEEGGILVSQYSATDLEERGLIKMDLLALRNLTILSAVQKTIRETQPDFNVYRIPLNDARVYSLFARADTTGIFQFESAGMRRLLQRIQPRKFADVYVANALFRPGAKDAIDDYLQGKAHPEQVSYYPHLKEVFAETYGVMIYQEQMMLTARIAAGFTLGKADILRKAASKKNSEGFTRLQTDFMNGCRQNGYSEKDAADLWERIEKFGGYGFNKSHAVAYGFISYQLAYCKALYPHAFYCALLDSVNGDVNKTAQYIFECRRKNIPILGPDINISTMNYNTEDTAIRMPLSSIRGLGQNSCALLINDRNTRGKFTDFYDFAARAYALDIGRKSMESCINAGALDCFGYSRRALLQSMDSALNYASLVQVPAGGQMTISNDLVSKQEISREIRDDAKIKMDNEKEALGFYLSEQKITSLRNQFNIKDQPLASIYERTGNVNGFAYIYSFREHRTKKGKLMAFLGLQDESAQIDMLVMPSQYEKYSTMLQKGIYIRFGAQISRTEEDISLICNWLQEVKDSNGKNTHR